MDMRVIGVILWSGLRESSIGSMIFRKANCLALGIFYNFRDSCIQIKPWNLLSCFIP